MEEIRISGKDLGTLALPNFCPRCFWIQRRSLTGIPYQIFPGIFSSIDAYCKNAVQSWFDRHQKPPLWLKPLGNIVSYHKPPHYTRFNFIDPETGIRLTGAPDAIFQLADGSLLIADYKTAKFTKTQDALFPVYDTQLNAYALIAERIKLGIVTRLALVYTEPLTDESVTNTDEVHSNFGFLMRFSANFWPVTVNTSKVLHLLRRARVIVSADEAPKGIQGCKDCKKIDELVELLNTTHHR